jgi:phosphotransferase system enzyme I (PtsI)
MQPAAGGDPLQQSEALRLAIDTALLALRGLIARSARSNSGTAGTADAADAVDAVEILSFQVAFLEDDELSRPAHVAIARGQAAAPAWRAALDAEIAGYQQAAAEYFRARASDLQDIRDRVLDALAGIGDCATVPSGALVVAEDLPPSRFLAIDWSHGGALALIAGSANSHVAMLARARGVPMLVGVGHDEPAALLDLQHRTHSPALLDADGGELIVGPAAPAIAAFAQASRAREGADAAAARTLLEPAHTLDGTRIEVHLNLADLAELDRLDPAQCDGVGLVRTEFLFDRAHGDGADRGSAHDGLPDEDQQYQAYRRILAWAAGRPVTIRTLDAGGDKPIAGLTVDGESNPFLGVRGLRLSMARPHVFRTQLRALARAAAHGNLKVMLPMVTLARELASARAMLHEELRALAGAGIECAQPQLGIMIEVPAAAIAADTFDADFFSIGSNDLTQYVAAAGRDNGAVADLADPGQPAVLRLVRRVVRLGRARGAPVSLCGDAGGDPRLIPALLAAGLRTLSMTPSAVARAKLAIAQVRL